MITAQLPAKFADLAPLFAKWGLPTENARSNARWSATPDDFKILYAAVVPHLPAILETLAAFPIDDILESVKPLYWLACGFAEAAPHHELYNGNAQVPHSFEARRFRALHGDDIN